MLLALVTFGNLGFMPSTELLRHSSIVQKLFARVIQHGLLRFRRQTRTCAQAAVDVYALAVDDAFKGSTHSIPAIFRLTFEQPT